MQEGREGWRVVGANERTKDTHHFFRHRKHFRGHLTNGNSNYSSCLCFCFLSPVEISQFETMLIRRKSQMTAFFGSAVFLWSLFAYQALAFTVQNPTFATRTGAKRRVNSVNTLHISHANSTIEQGIQLRASPMKTKMPTHDENGPVFAVHSVGDFLNFVENTEENELVVVK